MPLGPQDLKYQFPAFTAFSYRKRYWKQVNHKDTTLCIVGLQLRLGACEGVGALILLSTDRGTVALTEDLLRIMMDHVKGLDWWYRNGMLCACDPEVLIRYHSNAAHKSG